MSILIHCCEFPSPISAAEIEELTARAGSFKPFITFTKMLRTALQGASDTVTLNVSTIAGNPYMLAAGLTGSTFVRPSITVHLAGAFNAMTIWSSGFHTA